MEENKTILGILSSTVGEYLLVLLVVLGIFAFAFIVLIGEEIGSLSGAAFIVGGVYLIAVSVLILCMKERYA